MNNTMPELEEVHHSMLSKEIGVPVWVIALIAVFGLSLISLCIWCRCRKRKKRKNYNVLHAENKSSTSIQVNPVTPHKAPSMVTQPSRGPVLRYDMKTVMSSYERSSEIATCDAILQEVKSPSLTEDEIDDGVSQSERPRLKYKLDYDFVSNSLGVTVIQAEDLPALDSSGTSDPYCKVYLLPDRKKKFETQVVEKSLNPYFNETFVFKNLTYSDAMTKTLVFALYDHDRFTKNDAMGEIKVPLCQIDFADSKERWGEIHQVVDSAPGMESTLGELCFSLRYVPTSGRLTVVIIEARNLKKMDIRGLSDPYVKISQMLNGKRVRKKKTSIKKCTLDPYYNESFTFEIPFKDIKQTELVLTVIDYDRIGASEPIGQVKLSHNSTAEELGHWTEMFKSPCRAIPKWHTLNEIEEDSHKK